MNFDDFMTNLLILVVLLPVHFVAFLSPSNLEEAKPKYFYFKFMLYLILKQKLNSQAMSEQVNWYLNTGTAVQQHWG